MARYTSRYYNDEAMADLIASASYLIQKNSGDQVKAEWLLEGGLGSTRWKTANGKKHYKTSCGWTGTLDINFDILLPDGSSLIDAKNRKILYSLQRYAYFFRSGYLAFKPGPAYWAAVISWVFKFTYWVYLNKKTLDPERFGYSRITSNHLKTLFSQLARGGWSGALNTIPRILCVFYKLTFKRLPPPEILKNPMDLPPVTRESIIQMLTLRGAYIRKSIGAEHSIVSRKFVGDMIARSPASFKGLKIRIFLRQFEPSFENSKLLNTFRERRAAPSNKTTLLSEPPAEHITKKGLERQVNAAKCFFAGFIESSTGIPNIDVNQKQIILDYDSIVINSKHQNNIPLSFGLDLLNNAMKWVGVYGAGIVSAAIEFIEVCEAAKASHARYWDKREFEQAALNAILAKHKTVGLESMPSISIGEALSIKRITKKKHFTIDRSSLTFHQALFILIGACAICLATLKPFREDELVTLKRRCIFTDTLTNGAWLDSSQGKSGEQGVNLNNTRPIPYIAAHAAMLVQMLGERLSHIYKDTSPHASDLFYIPLHKGLCMPARPTVRNRLIRCMDLFSDYIETPLDGHGRRLYVRVHEMRKFFLLVLYWHEKDYGLDCGAWMAAHIDPTHIQAYTDTSDTAYEISEWEAQCVEDKLIDLEDNRLSPEEEPGLVNLYKKICRNFKVSQIKGLRKKDYISMLIKLKEQGDYQITPYIIYQKIGPKAPVGFDFVVKCGDKIHESYQHR
ncbi:hypothetical protein [Pseudomonas jessenii]|jgi:hypothetical protein|uniref:hypothetical protein n=1 Tax=Pseudomonas jessenii TaxID=77298 RepID=UPI0030EBA0C6